VSVGLIGQECYLICLWVVYRHFMVSKLACELAMVGYDRVYIGLGCIGYDGYTGQRLNKWIDN
jgi:hypothetical protein